MHHWQSCHVVLTTGTHLNSFATWLYATLHCLEVPFSLVSIGLTFCVWVPVVLLTNFTEWLTVSCIATFGSDWTCWYAAHWYKCIVVPSCRWAWIMAIRVSAVCSLMLVCEMYRPCQTPKFGLCSPSTIILQRREIKWHVVMYLGT